MKGKTVKVRVKKEFLNLAEILPLGFETEIVTDLEDEDIIGMHKVRLADNKTLIVKSVDVPKGNYKGFTFVGANGKKYNDKTITNAIGYIKLSELFKKM